jgi:hypothetical protein
MKLREVEMAYVYAKDVNAKPCFNFTNSNNELG